VFAGDMDRCLWESDGSLGTKWRTNVSLSEHDEARKADLEDLAGKIAQQIRDLREARSALGHTLSEAEPEEFAARCTLVILRGVLYAGGPLYDQVRRVLDV